MRCVHSQLLGTIIATQLNTPGSWHNLWVACSIYKILQERTPNRYYLVSDITFLHRMLQVSGLLKASLKDGDIALSEPAL